MSSFIKYRTILILCMTVFNGNVLFSQAMADNTLSGCNNYLYINGESNINQFRFSYNTPNIRNIDNISKDKESIEISIPIREFEASNPMMYADFLDLMNEAEHPRIIVSFSKRQLQSTLQDYTEPCPVIQITIAGITRSYNVVCSVVKCADNLYLRGEEVLKLSDFKLRPPSKLLGLVKVNDEINVDFGFIITFAGSNQLSSKF